MKIVLVGEYSRLHNSLKEGLVLLNHEVIILGTGDGFKNYPIDINIQSTFFNSYLLNKFKNVFYRFTKIDLCGIERGFRFLNAIKKIKNIDVLQLINEEAINANPFFEKSILKKAFKAARKKFLLSCGTDYISVKYAYEQKFTYSILTPYIQNPHIKEKYTYVLKYLTPPYVKLHQFIYQHINGVIASDIDYHIPLTNHPKYLGLIPNPINTDQILQTPLVLSEKIVIFHGINTANFYKKGNYLFAEALQFIALKYSNKVSIITTENIPYNEYISKYNSAHIILDQCYSYDQGYNALEAMAKGKVVFTGAEEAFLNYYQLDKNKVCINAIPDVNILISLLSDLIENPEKIIKIGIEARKFIEKEHHYTKIAQQYLNYWSR